VTACPDQCRLLFGPYPPPRVRKGNRTYCEFRGTQVIVTNWSEARLSWPRCQKPRQRGGSGLLVNDELRRAIESESSAALVYWFGIRQETVWRWRKAFGVGKWDTPGSQRLHGVLSRAGANGMKVKGWTAVERRRRSRTAKRLKLVRFMQPCSKPNGSRPWTRAELRMLGPQPDTEIAKCTGRTVNAVRQKREKQWATAID
jgi:hypothetical protein